VQQPIVDRQWSSAAYIQFRHFCKVRQLAGDKTAEKILAKGRMEELVCPERTPVTRCPALVDKEEGADDSFCGRYPCPESCFRAGAIRTLVDQDCEVIVQLSL